MLPCDSSARPSLKNFFASLERGVNSTGDSPVEVGKSSPKAKAGGRIVVVATANIPVVNSFKSCRRRPFVGIDGEDDDDDDDDDVPFSPILFSMSYSPSSLPADNNNNGGDVGRAVLLFVVVVGIQATTTFVAVVVHKSTKQHLP